MISGINIGKKLFLLQLRFNFQIASYNSYTEIVQKLISKGADLEIKSNLGFNALITGINHHFLENYPW